MAATAQIPRVIYNPGSYLPIFGAVARVTDFNPDSGLVPNTDFLNSQIGAILA